MTRRIALLSVLLASACGGPQTPRSDAQPSGTDSQPCSEQWQEDVEARFKTADSDGHGPDLGSPEWRSVVEFKVGIRGDPAIPSRETGEWCTYIDGKIRESGR